MVSDGSSRVSSRNTGLTERRHFRQDLDRGLDESNSQTGPCPLSQSQIEIEERLQLQSFEKHPMAPFNGPVRGNHVWPTARLQPNRDRRGSSGDESIQHDGHARCGAAQDDAGDSGNLKAADFREHI